MNDILQSKTLSSLVPNAAGFCADLAVNGLCLDSRQLQPGNLFVALTGSAADGKQFINDAVAAGACGVLAETDPGEVGVPVLVVPKLKQQLSDIAGRFFSDPSQSLNLIGVTGTNGKTTIAFLTAGLLEALGEPCGVIGTLGAGRIGDLQAGVNTTPDAIQVQGQLAEFRASAYRWAVMEVSSHGLVQYRVEGLRFRVALFSNLSPEHLDFHGSIEAYAEAKRRLFDFDGLEVAVVNADDPAAELMVQGCRPETRILRYSIADSSADLFCQLQEDGALLVRSPWGEGLCNFPLPGDFNRQNLLAALAGLAALDVPFDAMLAAVADLRSPPGRMQLLTHPGRPRVLIDYAHTPDALERVLQALRDDTAGELICVFGCGGDRDRKKRPLMGRIARTLSDRVIVTSDNPRSEAPEAIIEDILVGFDGVEPVVCVDREMAIQQAIREAGSEDTVLIAGKGHEDYQEIAGRRQPFSDSRCAWEQLRGGLQ